MGWRYLETADLSWGFGMTDRELLQLALDALEYHQSQTRPIGGTDAAIAALRQRLAQPELEPVECLWKRNGRDACYAPPQKDAP